MNTQPPDGPDGIRFLPPADETAWVAAPQALRLGDDEIHLWRIELPHGGRLDSQGSDRLSPAETERASRFRFERDRVRFVFHHGAAREILGRYLGVAPQEIAWKLGECDKPYLAGRPLEFNLSHSGDLAVLAISRRWAVGVDIEEMREIDDADSMAARLFSGSDRRRFAQAAPLRRAEIFFRIWTRTEARLKADGVGMAAIDRPDWLESDAIWQSPGWPDCCWCIHEFAARRGYSGAVAAVLRLDNPATLQHYQYPKPGFA